MDDTSDKYANFSHDELVAEINRLKKHKKYGLVWEHKTEKVIEDFETQQPYLEEVTDKRIEDAPGEPTNLIIEGDNFEALSILNYTHAGKVDVIYIDPPYNTGNKDFIYNDDYVDSEDEFRHSKWLSFMEPRLKLAKNLLKDDGVIFISIDDIEQSALKLLCDEIFGHDNFLTTIVNQSANSVFGTKAAHKDKTYIKIKDYVLAYAKTGLHLVNPLYLPSKTYIYDSHEFIIDDGKRYSTSEWFEEKYSEKFKKYGMRINKQTIQKMMDFDEAFKKEVLSRLLDKQFGTWPYTKDDLSENEKERLRSGEIIDHGGLKIIRENGGTGLVRFLRSLRESCQEIDGLYQKCDILGDVWNNAAGYGNINAEGAVKFANGKKPLLLLQKILKSSASKGAVILDFFAGSGTTGHAVLELNKEDGGHRQFILCTNNGDKGPDSTKIAEEITYPRIKTVITGERQDGGKYSDGIPANLRYYKINHREKKPSIDANRQDMAAYTEDIIQVKENAYKQLEVNEDLAIYESNEKYVGLVFEPFSLEEAIANLKERNVEKRPVKLYVFSYSRDAFEDDYGTDFEIEFVAMPEGLLKTYAHIVEEQKKEDL